MRTREGMAIARKGKLRGKQPKLSDKQQQEMRRMYNTGRCLISDLAELFSISRPAVYRTIACTTKPARFKPVNSTRAKPRRADRARAA